jgi:pantetheine-phosphate adenylyltransferase
VTSDVGSGGSLYPGSFDPIHNGHVDIVEQAAALFGGPVIVAAMVNREKVDGFFPLDERKALIEESLAHVRGVRVEVHAGLAVDAARAAGARFIVKGLRTPADFEIEMQMAHMNLAVTGVRTVFLPTDPGRGFISSRFIREIAKEGGDVSALVPAAVERRLRQRFGPLVTDGAGRDGR